MCTHASSSFTVRGSSSSPVISECLSQNKPYTELVGEQLDKNSIKSGVEVVSVVQSTHASTTLLLLQSNTVIPHLNHPDNCPVQMKIIFPEQSPGYKR